MRNERELSTVIHGSSSKKERKKTNGSKRLNSVFEIFERYLSQACFWQLYNMQRADQVKKINPFMLCPWSLTPALTGKYIQLTAYTIIPSRPYCVISPGLTVAFTVASSHHNHVVVFCHMSETNRCYDAIVWLIAGLTVTWVGGTVASTSNL